MSRNKKPSFWQRLKYLITAKQESTQVDSTGAESGASESQPLTQKKAQKPTQQQASKQPSEGSKQSQQQSLSSPSSEEESVKFIRLEDLDAADTKASFDKAQHNENQLYSDSPITDSILDYLEASGLSYYYHDPNDRKPEQQQDQKGTGDNAAQDRSAHDNEIARNVHHISMAMRYHKDKQPDEDPNNAARHDQDYSQEHRQDHDQQHTPWQQQQEKGDDARVDVESEQVEWGCVIRIHEHTQLVAMYGVLPFQLPATHLQAGLTLAAQLNYDMMLGCIEIDIRDGEIRFKNSLDFEPIIESHQGEIPAVVISYLLKGVMAMTASFAPLFSDLINSDPQDFELSNILEQRHQQQIENLFFLASTTPQ
ncbi:hypothetical protein [Psychrobacter sp. FDAARGOS_221]|uniref:hypothetical protein n=1 Tax=Psychrobacter sp. FDAARGOS_221 TaxID=1975705 RepID=UPI000BB59C49|nr:hypothetical protein [Psychrobacter sp. FDAARGOS_221]PNK60985.1 hypothetical protein A6J60_008895 [Psychrobacter sp. FDAARGOS_221]